MTRFAFVGFRHAHIRDMFQRCQQREDVSIVACCEEDAATREQLAAEGVVRITHDSAARLLAEVDCDVVAVGDCYGRRASIVLAALAAGRHVISDKPLCVSLEELDRIEAAATKSGRCVGLMLDMRDLAPYLGLRQLIRRGALGEVRAIGFDGQHPLLYGRRPSWYFEPGMHGGTLNDIAIHALDMIPWATGRQLRTVVAARGWNANVPQHPDFQQCGQALLTLDNGAGVVCDVSYLTPDSIAYQMPLYWRFTVWCDQGTVEVGVNMPQLMLYRNGEPSPRGVDLPRPRPGEYLQAFLAEIRGETLVEGQLTSRDSLRAQRIALRVQQAADSGACHVSLES